MAGLSHLAHGNVDMVATAWLLLGSIPGVLLGSQITVRVPERTLRAALGGVLLLSGIKLLDLPGSDALVVGVFAGGVAGAGIYAFRTLNRRRPALARR